MCPNLPDVRIYPTLPYRVVYTCSEVELSGDETMCGSRGGDRGSGPPLPRKITSYMGFYRNQHLDPGPPPPPPLEKLDTLDPLKSIVVSVIKP